MLFFLKFSKYFRIKPAAFFSRNANTNRELLFAVLITCESGQAV